MNFREREVKIAYIKEAIACIAFGTAIGLGVYGIFLYFHIDIFGWNLGLIFAPLAAGYAETILADKIIGENIGAISAFILFIDTTFYSFILKNPTLGVNIITFGSIAVILQAAFPTVVNYILIVGGLGIISYISGIFKRITSYIYKKINHTVYRKIYKKEPERVVETVKIFDETISNERINSLNFIFMTSSDLLDKKHENLGIFQSTVIIERRSGLVTGNPQATEQKTLYNLKKGKDDCLVKLAESIKASGGNAILDLEIQYGLIGLGGENFQITTIGMGLKLE